MMTLKRFRTLADSYGADLRRWPERLRPQALVLLDSSAEARTIIARAKELDEAIAAAEAARSERFRSGDLGDAALVRLRNTVAARIAPAIPASADAARGIRPRRAGRSAPWCVRWISLATAASVAILAGFVLGIRYPPVPSQQDLLALLQPSPIQVLTD
jgi:hypothetical protein